jgi:chromosomal replication initiation ATPase DnaA
MFERCLLNLHDIFTHHCYDLKTMEGFCSIFPNFDTRANSNENRLNTHKRMHALLYTQSLEAPNPKLLSFNVSQTFVSNAIRGIGFQASSQCSRIFFIYGPGGTGKTFVFNALLDCIRQSENIAIAVASRGTAALLLKGRRNVHSKFKITIGSNNHNHVGHVTKIFYCFIYSKIKAYCLG